MVELKPSYLQELCYTAQEDRLVLSGLVCGEGVSDVVGDSLKVTTGGSGLDVSVAQGGCFIEGDDDDRGMYWCYNDAPVTVTLSAANGTNPRIDQVIARLYDTTYGEGADEWVLEKLDGTATGGATLTNLTGAAALPDNSVRLAYVLVPAAFAGPFVDATHIKDARTEFVSCGQPFQPYIELTAAAGTSLTNNVDTKVNLTTVAHNDDEYFSVSASVITILRAGRYDIFGYVYLTSSAAITYVSTHIDLNGFGGWDWYGDVGGGGAGVPPIAVQNVALAVGDTIQLGTYQTSGGGKTTGTANVRLMVRKVG